MYAIIECGGKQYRVQEGDLLRVEKIEAEIGSTITIDKVFLLGGDKTVVGTPVVEGAKVTCKVMNQDKDKKILVFHYKAKKNIRKRYGHRQPFTSLLIEKIEKVKKAAKKATTESAEKVESVEA
jgi:large subunit ribosomal protein L21